MVTLLIAATLLAASSGQQVRTDTNMKDARMDWWRKARFGLFIHWGLYAVPAGKWGEETDYGEWIRDSAQIPLAEYEKFQKQFNPTKFDADKWVAMAKNAGMKYIVITSKHHDGFDLFDSKFTTWDVMGTPYRKDIMRQMADACRKGDLKIGWYHSIMDWHHPDYLPRRGWENRPVGNANFDRFVDYLHNQVTELLTNYGDIGIMWFDGQWEPTWSNTYGKQLYDLCRRLQPNVIVNDRADGIGDYLTPEQTIPEEAIEGKDWETCMTMNRHWGYNAMDKDYKSSKDLIRMLCDIASKGGNFLLNIGPMANGEFPPESAQRLADIGRWMKVNGESIYDTGGSPIQPQPWGRCTVRPDEKKSTLYFQVFDWPKDAKLNLPMIGNIPITAYVLGNKSVRLPIRQGNTGVAIDLPQRASDQIATVVALEVRGMPIIFNAPKIISDSDVFVTKCPVTLSSGSPRLIVRYTLDGSMPGPTSPVYSRPLELSRTMTIKARSFFDGRAVTPVVEKTISRVSPWRAATGAPLRPGLDREIYDGSWSAMPVFSGLKGTRSVATGVAIPTEADREHVGMRLSGFLRIATDDVYRFGLTSDDGGRLYIDDQLVVDNDGLHVATEKHGSAPLARGAHKVVVEWYNATGSTALALRWARLGENLAPVPDSAFGR
jgi:alpha-L-fucosidase